MGDVSYKPIVPNINKWKKYMDFDYKKNRLLLIIIDSFPEDTDIRSISSLPYLGMLSKNGVWARVKKAKEFSGEMTLEAFTNIQSSTSSKPEPFWNVLEENGITIKMFTIRPQKPFLEQVPKNELSATDCIFLGVIASREVEENEEPKRLDHVQLEILDKDIESIALAAGEETAVWVISLPFSKDDAGWFIAGRAQVAPAGNPGIVTFTDIVLTIFWWFNLDVQLQKEGRILEEIREKDGELSQDEMDLLTDHLRGLGYLG
jgi:hypothetical protein